MKSKLIIAFIAGLVVAGLVWRFGASVPMQGGSQIDLTLIALLSAAGALLVAVLSGLAVNSALRRTKRLSRDLEIFEREMTQRLQTLEGRRSEKQKPFIKADLNAGTPESKNHVSGNDVSKPAIQAAYASGEASTQNASEPMTSEGFGTNGSESVERFEPDKRDDAQPPQREIEKALQDGGLTAWFLPIVSLPERATRYLQSVAYLAIDDQKPAPAQNWFKQARRRGLVGEIDAQMLEQSIRLARQLKRSGKKAIVICRLNRDTLSRPEWCKPVLKMLEANSAIHKRLVLEIALPDFLKLKQDAREQLVEMRQSGYSLLLSECEDLADLRRAAESELFELVSVDSSLVVAGGVAGGMAHLASVRESLGRNSAIIAANVHTEDIAIEMIDNDILLAQGPLFSLARPLKDDAVATRRAATKRNDAAVR